MELFKLYHRDSGYRCKVNRKEIAFLFGIDKNLTPEEINLELTQNNTGYYIAI